LLYRQTLLLEPHLRDRLTVRTVAHNSRVMRPVFEEMNERRAIVELNNKLKGENPIDRRSSYLEWNYSAELYAFTARLGESIEPKMLERAFTTAGHIELERRKQEKLGIEGVNLNMIANDELSREGEKQIEAVVQNWLRTALPYLPEEGIQAVKSYLLSEDVLAEVSFHIGTKDLILAVEYPPLKSDYVKAFKAVVGALAANDGVRAEKFILDLVAVQLVGKNIDDIWDIRSPMSILTTILDNEERGEPEARLLWRSGPSTLLSSFAVGIYSDKQLIGEFHGESLEIAEEMAARDALRRFFKTTDSMTPLPVDAPVSSTKPNLPVQDWTSGKIPNLIVK